MRSSDKSAGPQIIDDEADQKKPAALSDTAIKARAKTTGGSNVPASPLSGDVSKGDRVTRSPNSGPVSATSPGAVRVAGINSPGEKSAPAEQGSQKVNPTKSAARR